MRENLQLAKLGIPYVVTPNGGYEKLVLKGRNRLGKAIWFKLWERSYLRKARMIHAVSLPERKAIANLQLNVPVRYIPNGIDDEIFDRKTDAPSRHSDLLYLGRLALDQKGLDLLLQGYAKARMEVPEMPRLMLAGPDFRRGRVELTAMARALDIADNVVFVGPVYGVEKWRLLSQARLFIHVSRWEGMPFALLEAMATGRPVLITPGTNLAEEVGAAGAGVAVDCSIDAIAAGLRRFACLSDESLDRMGRCAWELSKAKFSWPKVVGELSSEYRAIAAH
jgi:glycosyltransferase involved in cell wall biosynthesis